MTYSNIKSQGLTLYLEDTNLKKNTGMVKWTPPPAFQRLKMMKNAFHFIAQYLTMQSQPDNKV